MKVQELAAKNAKDAKEISRRDAEAQSDIGYTSQVVLKCRDSKSALYLAAAIVYNGIAPPPDPGGVASGMPYLPGFEMMFLKSLDSRMAVLRANAGRIITGCQKHNFLILLNSAYCARNQEMLYCARPSMGW